MFITSYTFLLHLVLASHGAILTSQLEELHVSFISSKYSIVTVKTQTGCDDSDPSGGKMMVEVYTCPMNTSSPLPPYTIKGVCKEDGAKFCLSPFFRHAGCVMMKGKMGALEYLSSELSLTNTTFYNRAENNAASTSWVQEGNTSVLHFLPVAGVPVYKLMLEATSNNMSDKCGTLWLTGDTEASSSTVVFKAHWHQQVIPSCTYSTYFMAEDGCGREMLFGRAVELPQLQYKHPTNKRIALEPVNTRVYVAALGTSSLLLLVVLVLFFVTLHQARKRQRIPAPTTLSLTPLKRCEVSSSPQPTVLLVYTPDLLPQMADLATHLKKLTGLQIEDLHDVEDQDKLNDPTVWLTRRLMDANTRFVLACSSARQENKESSEELQEGSIVHFLLDHFLQYLHSSSLAYDYTRLHHVRLEDQAQVDMSDVTPGRVYQLPAHLPQLARNLTIATPTTTTNPSDTPSAACEA